ncbi:hypothetical protein SH528x_002073 [Novipirellula sp. SH528]
MRTARFIKTKNWSLTQICDHLTSASYRDARDLCPRSPPADC